MRYALVSTTAPSQVGAYLPDNYRVLSRTTNKVLIGGKDSAGWTLEDYVIPRLGSGLHAAKELPAAQALAILRGGW